jgi:hypothetical protein
MICLSLKPTCYQVTAAQSADAPEFMLRLNFGLALIKRHKVCAVEGFVVHNFHLKLPELRARETDRSPIRRNLTSTCAADANCMRMYALARSVASMSNSKDLRCSDAEVGRRIPTNEIIIYVCVMLKCCCDILTWNKSTIYALEK